MIILGFVLGSVAELFPGIPGGIGEIIASVIAFAAGFVIILKMK